MLDNLINTEPIVEKENVILLQVSATPYSLVTKNSRIENHNIIDMAKELDSKLPEPEDEKIKANIKTYYGLRHYVKKSQSIEETSLSHLEPGTLTSDEDFEKSTRPQNALQNYCLSRMDKTKTKSADLKKVTELYGLIFQWIRGMMHFAEFSNLHIMESTIADVMNGRFKSSHRRDLGKNEDNEDARITKRMLKGICNQEEQGKGKMALVRLLGKKEGKVFVKILREVRDALGLKN